MHDPAISVVMPAYNAGKYIREAISSVLCQSFGDFELLIVNDGSTDDTQKIIRSFPDQRIKLINQTNQGIAAALNRGLAEAKAPVVARFDADDICLPGRLRVQFDFMNTHPEYIIIGSGADFIDMDNNYVFTYSPPWYSNEAIQAVAKNKCPFIHSSVLFKKAVILNAGGYNVHAYAFEDHLLWLKILQKGRAVNIPQVLLKVRLNPESVTMDEKWQDKRFSQIKYKAINDGNITETAGKELKRILKKQGSKRMKEGAYYCLLGKKYLWNNYQPGKARINLKKTISLQPWVLNTWGLLLLSYMPEGFIQRLYSWSNNLK